MKKIYIVQWGFYSSLDGGSELDSIWSTKELAYNYMEQKAKDYFRKLEKFGIDHWTDGDYWTSISEVNLDNESLYSFEEADEKK